MKNEEFFPIGMTITEHFEKAKADGYEWADKAIENRRTVLGRKRKDKAHVPDLQIALMAGFDWKTTQGVDYWGKIYKSVRGK